MIYFDNSATSGFKPQTVINATANTCTHLSANPGRSGHALSMRAGLLVYRTRQRLAEYLGLLDCDRIAFSLNCTQSLNMAILGTVKNKGNVIITAYEHNAVIRPLFELQRKGYITVTVLNPNKDGVVTDYQIEKAIKPSTYLVVTNHISNVTGAKTDVHAIALLCKKHGLLYLVDGAQSVGYTEIDMAKTPIDMLAIAPHKGLHAIQGVGVLALGGKADPSPILYGGTGTSSESVYQPDELPERLESGTLPTPAIAALNAAIEWNKQNRKKMNEKLTEFSSYLYAELDKMPSVRVYTPKNAMNGIIAFNILNKSSSLVSEILSDKYNICVRGGLHCAPLIHSHLGTLASGIVRVSFGIENTYPEVNKLIESLHQIVKL